MKSLIDALKIFAERLPAPQSTATGLLHFSNQGRRVRRRKSHQPLSFEALQPRQLLATTAVIDGAWTDPTIWSDGVPDVSVRAIIGHGVSVQLDGANHFAQELVIQGELNVTEDATGGTKMLTTRWIHVNSNGLFKVGDAANRYDSNDFVVTLTGTDVNEDPLIETMGEPIQLTNNDGFLMTAMGGRVEFYGEEKLSFTKLHTTAASGDMTITVENLIERNFDKGAMIGDDFVTSAADDGVVNWQIGDQIVIASSSYDYTQEDVRTITAMVDNGDETSTLTLNQALTHRHYGEIEVYGETTAPGTTAATQTHAIDMRAEVALLSRNVKIQGLAAQDTDNEFGDRGLAEFETRVRAAGLSDAEWGRGETGCRCLLVDQSRFGRITESFHGRTNR